MLGIYNIVIDFTTLTGIIFIAINDATTVVSDRSGPACWRKLMPDANDKNGGATNVDQSEDRYSLGDRGPGPRRIRRLPLLEAAEAGTLDPAGDQGRVH